MMMQKTYLSQSILMLLGLAALGCAVFQMVHFSSFTVDDAYISYRYAENLAIGEGLVFNSGEYVEGYTNFLWVILLGLLKMSGIPIRSASLALGVSFSLLTLLAACLLSSRIVRASPSAERYHPCICAALLCLATSPAFGVWAVAGLETPLFACLLTFAVLMHIREQAESGFPYSAVFFGLAALTRPEGMFYFGVSFLYGVSYHVVLNHRFPPKWRRSLLLFSTFVIPHLLWRWSYYGSLLPNTYYIKLGGTFRLSGVKYVAEFFLTYGSAALFLLCCLILAATRLREYWVGYVLCLLGLSLLYFMYTGGDWMPEFRFFVPVLPLFFLVLQEGIRELPALFLRKHIRVTMAGSYVIIGAVLANHVFYFMTLPVYDSTHDGHVEIGHVLREQAASDDVLAAIDIGAMAYFSGLRTIDYFGLADAHIARLQPQEYHFEPGFWGHKTFTLKSDIDYVLGQKPTFIELNTLNHPQNTEETIPLDPYSDLMLRHPEFQQQYAPWYYAGGTMIFKRTI